ncbi:hypothetical protein NL676_021250 [Syzygium grande]|nr:hypothetical protein NL676_021250 [Syzygium grande]
MNTKERGPSPLVLIPLSSDRTEFRGGSCSTFSVRDPSSAIFFQELILTPLRLLLQAIRGLVPPAALRVLKDAQASKVRTILSIPILPHEGCSWLPWRGE